MDQKGVGGWVGGVAHESHVVGQKDFVIGSGHPLVRPHVTLAAHLLRDPVRKARRVRVGDVPHKLLEMRVREHPLV